MKKDKRNKKKTVRIEIVSDVAGRVEGVGMMDWHIILAAVLGTIIGQAIGALLGYLIGDAIYNALRKKGKLK